MGENVVLRLLLHSAGQHPPMVGCGTGMMAVRKRKMEEWENRGHLFREQCV